MNDNHKVTFFRDFIEAVANTIAASEPAKRELLAETMLNYLCGFPDDYYWATGPQAPTLLSSLLNEIDLACRRQKEKAQVSSLAHQETGEDASKGKPAIYLAWDANREV
jgi:hypothetical protein